MSLKKSDIGDQCFATSPSGDHANSVLIVSNAVMSAPATALPTGELVDVPLLPLTFDGAHLPKRSDVPAPGEHNGIYRDGEPETAQDREDDALDREDDAPDRTEERVQSP